MSDCELFFFFCDWKPAKEESFEFRMCSYVHSNTTLNTTQRHVWRWRCVSDSSVWNKHVGGEIKSVERPHKKATRSKQHDWLEWMERWLCAPLRVNSCASFIHILIIPQLPRPGWQLEEWDLWILQRHRDESSCKSEDGINHLWWQGERNTSF